MVPVSQKETDKPSTATYLQVSSELYFKHQVTPIMRSNQDQPGYLPKVISTRLSSKVVPKLSATPQETPRVGQTTPSPSLVQWSSSTLRGANKLSAIPKAPPAPKTAVQLTEVLSGLEMNLTSDIRLTNARYSTLEQQKRLEYIFLEKSMAALYNSMPVLTVQLTALTTKITNNITLVPLDAASHPPPTSSPSLATLDSHSLGSPHLIGCYTTLDGYRLLIGCPLAIPESP